VVATHREVVYKNEGEDGIRIRFRRSEPPPPYTYAITIEAEEDEDRWATVRLWDNADDVHEHHVHEYTRQEGKQKPMIRTFKSVNEAMAVAIDEARGSAAEIVRQWRES
jgi:hypothetical protein